MRVVKNRGVLNRVQSGKKAPPPQKKKGGERARPSVGRALPPPGGDETATAGKK